ncbi:MAG: cbb3-type cytochrome oxidase assembly protein CcoS [Bdellovibrionaceae bacterium]|nr:cbb3-type cytochrome oxidase assembly protein CcoS [Pseudobdellovibrionaceae bacterium]MBX3034029.1 cbb3-type cytochrome oxidase assembly protein CcoS [Pseudobdellovibrionaceae bacterium]
MNILLVLVPLALLLSLSFMIAFLWATRSGQWDDLDLTPMKILDETPAKEGNTHEEHD